jgi:hypothetical protein
MEGCDRKHELYNLHGIYEMQYRYHFDIFKMFNFQDIGLTAPNIRHHSLSYVIYILILFKKVTMEKLVIFILYFIHQDTELLVAFTLCSIKFQFLSIDMK